MIQSVSIRDVRYPIGDGHGSDAIHRAPIYSYAVTELHDDRGRAGIGLAFTLGEGNQLVCEAASFYARRLVGKPIEEIMTRFGALQREMADEQQFRWLGPHKGIVQLALASVTNACWDLWAKSRGLPLWKLLLDLSPEEVVATSRSELRSETGLMQGPLFENQTADRCDPAALTRSRHRARSKGLMHQRPTPRRAAF